MIVSIDSTPRYMCPSYYIYLNGERCKYVTYADDVDNVVICLTTDSNGYFEINEQGNGAKEQTHFGEVLIACEFDMELIK